MTDRLDFIKSVSQNKKYMEMKVLKLTMCVRKHTLTHTQKVRGFNARRD